MKVYVKFDINALCRKILQEQLDASGINYRIIAFGEIEILDKLSAEKQRKLEEHLGEYGIQIVENQKNILVQKIKDAIVEMVNQEENQPSLKSSVYLAEKLNHSYNYISNLFSEVTYSSIESFIILQKIERAKQLILMNELTFTEISYKLNYCNVAHFSTQFKNTTGITPSAFQRIIKKRRELQVQEQMQNN
ncbi:helix-turn-helix domain-containing protein [Flavobacterium aurantiibacter]|uniref:AraC family transcriptional regulator n=1 Tax=Flavobacterium aurantiibacter TaxID=2023067 RepID=A0A256A8N0_9FLAO|nr:AraC family transcriptional regulator [Flavobacterium aurantiibacter]OYQ50023.1 AraC family transcriptional regulator [Flavobacterium aurantiibacter]